MKTGETPRGRDPSKLPKWAQRRIETLERDVASWKAKATAGPEDSDTFIKQWTADDTPLGQSPDIAFRWPDEHSFRGEVEIVVRHSDDSIQVQGTDSLVITCQASNVIHIRQRAR